MKNLDTSKGRIAIEIDPSRRDYNRFKAMNRAGRMLLVTYYRDEDDLRHGEGDDIEIIRLPK